MKKRMFALALSALLLTGCGGQEPPAETVAEATGPVTAATEVTAGGTAEATGATRFTQPAETLPDPAEETVALSYTAYQVTYTYLQDNGQEFYTFQGIDPEGNIAWTKESAHLDMAQIQRIMPIGTWEDRFFYNESGTVVALHLVTGEELWRNEEFGGSFSAETAAVVDPEGFLYLCGGESPDLFVCDVDGNTVKRIDRFDPDHFWPFEIRREGDELVISLEGDSTGSGEIHTHRVEMDWLPQPQG